MTDEQRFKQHLKNNWEQISPSSPVNIAVPFDLSEEQAWAVYDEVLNELRNAYSDEEITKEGEEIFGSFSLSQARADAEEYYIRVELSYLEMNKFYESLPEWVSESDQFPLYMMTDAEREQWLSDNTPKVTVFPENVPDTKAPYFSKTLSRASNAVAVKLGNGIIVR